MAMREGASLQRLLEQRISRLIEDERRNPRRSGAEPARASSAERRMALNARRRVPSEGGCARRSTSALC